MPDFSDDFNPFSSPLEVEVVEPPKRSPGGVTAICIIAIVLGGFGLLAALLSGVGLFSGLQAQAALGPQPVGVSPEMEQIQERMRIEMAPVMRQYMIPRVFAVLLHFLSAFVLLLGGILTLQRKPMGPGILTFGCLVSILYVLGDGILNVLIQLKMLPIMRPHMEEMMAEAARQAGQGGEALGMMPKLLMAGVMVGLVVSAVLALVKIVYYVITVVFLRKDDVRQFFEPNDTLKNGF